MTLTNISKPSAASLTNIARVAIGETWATITTTWATETRTWAATVSVMTNTSTQSASLTNIAKPA